MAIDVRFTLGSLYGLFSFWDESVSLFHLLCFGVLSMCVNIDIDNLKSSFLKYVISRGMVYQCTDLNSLDSLFSSSSSVGYIGFDCTAESLHIGSLVQIMFLRHMQKFGHKPLVLIGDITSKVGDPSGKNKSRALLSDDVVERNALGITEVIASFFSENKKPKFTRNSEWLGEMNCISFLREVGINFSVNKMLENETFRNRIKNEENLSFLEFSYPLFQSYDFVQLAKKYNCCVQIGGSDQWGNIVAGVDLARRFGIGSVFGLTTPLLTNFKGEKMGKTVEGAIWLTEKLYPTHDFWQYFRNVHDSDVRRFLCLLTDLELVEIDELCKHSGVSLNEAKKILATEVTRICRGEEAAESIGKSTVSFFENKDASLLRERTVSVSESSITLVSVLQLVGFASSNSEAKRIITAKGCRINNELVIDPSYLINKSHDKKFVLSFGKKKHVNVVIEWID